MTEHSKSKQDIEAHFRSGKFNKAVSITVRCSEYSNRQQTITKSVEQPDGSKSLEEITRQVDDDLPGTVDDEEQYEEILNNFQFKDKDWQKFVLQEPTWDDIEKVLEETYAIVESNANLGERTFVSFFYAGHGAVINNKQVIILNGYEEDSIEQEYIHHIEHWFKKRFNYFGNYSYVFAVFDCCRSMHKEREVLYEPDTIIEESFSTEGIHGVENTFNFLFVHGTPSNSVLFDKNPLVESLVQEFRAQVENGCLSFPHCLVNLPARFPGCMTQNASTNQALTGYIDYFYKILKVDKAQISFKLNVEEKQMKKVVNFDETVAVEFAKCLKVKDGTYTGSIKNGVPFGFGGIIFNKGVNHHPVMTHDFGHKINTENFIFYEGNFINGVMNGKGTLLCDNDKLQIGTFIENEFCDQQGKCLQFNHQGLLKVTMGSHQHGLANGHATKMFNHNEIQHSQFLNDQPVGKGLNIYVTGNSDCGLRENHQRNGLCYFKFKSGNEYCGLFKNSDYHGIGTEFYKNGEIYKGQWIDDKFSGYGFYYWPDGSAEKGFYLNGKEEQHGIAVYRDSNGKIEYRIYNHGSKIESLSQEDVQAINEGSRKIPQMGVYNDEKFLLLHDEHLTFDWIERTGRSIEILADDLVALAVKNNLDKHEIPQELNDELKELLQSYRPMLAEVKQKMKNYKKIQKTASQKVSIQTDSDMQKKSSEAIELVKSTFSLEHVDDNLRSENIDFADQVEVYLQQKKNANAGDQKENNLQAYITDVANQKKNYLQAKTTDDVEKKEKYHKNNFDLIQQSDMNLQAYINKDDCQSQNETDLRASITESAFPKENDFPQVAYYEGNDQKENFLQNYINDGTNNNLKNSEHHAKSTIAETIIRKESQSYLQSKISKLSQAEYNNTLHSDLMALVVQLNGLIAQQQEQINNMSQTKQKPETPQQVESQRDAIIKQLKQLELEKEFAFKQLNQKQQDRDFAVQQAIKDRDAAIRQAEKERDFAVQQAEQKEKERDFAINQAEKIRDFAIKQAEKERDLAYKQIEQKENERMYAVQQVEKERDFAYKCADQNARDRDEAIKREKLLALEVQELKKQLASAKE